MIITYVEALLGYLTLTAVFWPVGVVLLLLSLACLPGTLDGDARSNYRANDGVPLLSILGSVTLLWLLGRYLGLSIPWNLGFCILVGTAFVLYVGVGFVWANLSWRRFCSLRAASVQKRILWFIDQPHFSSYADLKANTATDENRVKFYYWLYDESNLDYSGNRPHMEYRTNSSDKGDKSQRYVPLPWSVVIAPFVPQVSSYKSHVASWVLCWPLSVLKWLLGPALADVVNTVFNACKARFQAIANSAFKDI